MHPKVSFVEKNRFYVYRLLATNLKDKLCYLPKRLNEMHTHQLNSFVAHQIVRLAQNCSKNVICVLTIPLSSKRDYKVTLKTRVKSKELIVKQPGIAPTNLIYLLYTNRIRI